MKKILLTLFVMLSDIGFVPFVHAEALQHSTQPIELKDEVSKDFILKALSPWISNDHHEYYRQHYGAKKSIRIGLDNPGENITVWMESTHIL